MAYASSRRDPLGCLRPPRPRAASFLRRPALSHAVAGDPSACGWSLRSDRECQALVGMRSRPQRQVWERRPSAAGPTPAGGARSRPPLAYTGGTAEANDQSFEIPSSWALLRDMDKNPRCRFGTNYLTQQKMCRARVPHAPPDSPRHSRPHDPSGSGRRRSQGASRLCQGYNCGFCCKNYRNKRETLWIDP